MRTLIMISLLISSVSFGQNFQGKAIYKTHRKMSITVNSDKKSANNALQKQLQERLKKMYQKEYTLSFDKNQSTYVENASLEPASKLSGVMSGVKMISSGGGSTVLYKNVSKNTYRNQKELSGKCFLITDTLPKYDWKLSSETKKIGNYTCYKATKTKQETRSSFSMTDGKQEETKKKITIETVAWYTLEVPVSNGPGMYGGLPGLILEIQEGKQTILCTELTLNPKEKLKIEPPKRGKKVSQTEYDKIQEVKTKEMIKRFSSGKSTKSDKNTISIEIK